MDIQELRAWVQVAAAVITAVSTTIGALRLWHQRKELRLSEVEAQQKGIDVQQAEQEDHA
jgi:ABC-type Fe3+-siderophore transport system permease subunit